MLVFPFSPFLPNTLYHGENDSMNRELAFDFSDSSSKERISPIRFRRFSRRFPHELAKMAKNAVVKLTNFAPNEKY
jgi:hypothetical protein